MPKFRKKPDNTIYEAEQYGPDSRSPKGICRDATCIMADDHVHTAHEHQAVALAEGDWIMPEPDGRGFYPIKPDIFEARYQPE